MDAETFIEALNAEAVKQEQLRSRSFADTLDWIAPLLSRCGVTRVTSVTGLDSLGIPTYCSVRPGGMILQVSNGKGLTTEAAQASAAMEAIELFHAETPDPAKLRTISAAGLSARAEGARLLCPDELPRPRDVYFSPDFLGEWTHGTDLLTGQEVWVPSGAVYLFRRPATHHIHTNGIASGNTVAEAQLHALYELVERDAMARLYSNGVLKIRERATIVDTTTIDEPVLRALLDRCHACDTNVVLLSLPSAIPVHSFWAVFLGETSIAEVSTFNIGSGCHIDPVVAATRALTEAAQARLAFIHGGRDDVVQKPVSRAKHVKQSTAYRFFADLTPDGSWHDIVKLDTIKASLDPGAMSEIMVTALADAGLGPLFAFDLTKSGIEIPVVRVIGPKLGFRPALH